MKLQIYSIYDNKAGTWLKPFYSTNQAVAQRTFADAVNDNTSAFYAHPTDYVLYHLGEYDDQKGKITVNETNENMGMANDYLKQDTDLRAVQ